jgi:predicted dehydrogenase
MNGSPQLRVGVIGVGNMGGRHALALEQGKVAGAVLAAVCDPHDAQCEPFAGARRFASARELCASGAVDAIVVATPHYDHPESAMAGLAAGLHVLVEKPLAVHKADAERMLAAFEARPRREQVFAEMFNQRTDPRYRKLKQLIDTGELGALQRVNWIITDWFRPAAYYRSGGWRASWRGEGGGVLLNQAPHQLDLLQWLFGMPRRVRAFCGFGRFHAIEVEDQVTAYLEYESGATGVFVTTTGEAPGTNRLEVAAERGKVVIEGDGLRFFRNEVPTSEFSATTTESFAAPPVWKVEIPTEGSGSQHLGILQNFVDTIAGKAELLAPATEGIHSVELANSMLQSALEDRTIELPLDARAYAARLEQLILGGKP